MKQGLAHGMTFKAPVLALLAADQVVERIMVVAVVPEDTLQEALLVQQVQ